MTERTKNPHAILTKSAASEGYRNTSDPRERTIQEERKGERRSARLPMRAPLMAARKMVKQCLYVDPDVSWKQAAESGEESWN